MANIPKIIADFETSLSGAVAISDTTATLQSATDSDGNALAAGLYAFTIDRSSSLKEHFVGTLSGTALTAISSVDRRGNLTSGFVRAHRTGANIILSNHSGLSAVARTLSGELDLDSTNPLKYDGEPTLTDNDEIATKLYVDNSGGGYTGNNKILLSGNAGETVAAGDILYFKTSDQEWYKADADTAYGDDVQFGVAQGAGTDGATITGGVLLRGLDDNQTGMTAGATQYISATAGDITESAPTNDIFVGVAKSTTDLIVNYDNRITDYVSSDDITQSGILQEQTVSTNTIEVGEADATTKKNSLAQSFVASKTKMRGFNLYKKADTGTFTGTVTITLQADSSGEPSGSALATATLTNAQWLVLTDAAEFEALFATEYASVVVGDTYWIDIQPSTSDNSNHINLGADTSGGDGTVYYNNTTDGWVQIASSYLYYDTLEGNNSQVVKTETNGKISTDLLIAVQEFYADGTWNKPDQGTFAIVELWGAGGSGGTYVNNDNGVASTSGSGGAGGSYAQLMIPLEGMASTVAVTIGTGGVAAVATSTSEAGTAGNTGGNTTFGSYGTATGGPGGIGDDNNNVAGGVGTDSTGLFNLNDDGGNGTTASFAGSTPETKLLGAGGGGAGYTDNSATTVSDPGTSQEGGDGGAGDASRSVLTVTASDGVVPGGGGGGAAVFNTSGTKTATSGAGADGFARITTY